MESRRNLMVSFIALFFTLQTQAYSIISDLDDTLKITNAGNLVPASYNGVFTKKMFSGTRSFLLGTELSRDQFFVLSASPHILYKKVEGLLRDNNLKVDQIFLRKNIKEEKFKYKVRTIKGILETHPDDDFVLIGDDVDKDPEVYQEILKLYPSRIKAIYIRVIKNRPFLGQSFHLTAELAHHEFWAGRLDLVSVFHVLQDHQEDSIFKILPKFAYCPKDFNWRKLCDPSLEAECTRLERRIEHHCQLRGK
jgi:phosphatidate phosphatase APP1